MRRRILVAILGTVALSLVLAGAGSYVLLRRSAVRSAEANLREEAEGIVGLLALARANQAGSIQQRQIVDGLELEGMSLVIVTADGEIRGQVPDGVAVADLDGPRLLAGGSQGGRQHGVLWAAAGEPLQKRAVAVVLTRSDAPPRAPVGWFLAAGACALLVGAGVAGRLSLGLARPLREAEDATTRIAGGDLAVRLPEPRPTADDEAARLARSINAMAAALAAERDLERRFLLSVSHDLRTPLTSIRGYAEAIADGTAPVPADAARVIGTESQRLGRLVGDLLDLARLDADEFSFHPSVLPVGEVVAETAEGFRPAAHAAGVALVVTEPQPGTDALIDPDRLAQVVANLVENGLKYAASEVRVDHGPLADGGVRIEVADDGPGIAPDELARVFDRLYGADRRPARGSSGAGLGLAIAHELVTALGGTVRAVPSSTGAATGARFVIELPPPTGLSSGR